ncbi:MAG TPA: oligopeptide/dipeptide ABC transporter ATP-binding protein [Ilumatobacter sp.]|nr:oligopeptide/dipeptide ABC transporter ATP-binding protein [Ilumatobacter sp.]
MSESRDVPLLRALDLTKVFSLERDLLGRMSKRLVAVDRVSLDVRRGETLAIVGESGAGKSTVGRMFLRLIEPDDGQVLFEDDDIGAMRGKQLRELRRRVQMIFQDPFKSLDPRMTVRSAVEEALIIHSPDGRAVRRRRTIDALARVGIQEDAADRYPHEFSGGQLQRIAIARALAVESDVLVCDEPVAALDVSIRAQVVNLLQDLQQERRLTLVFITHDLSVLRQIATSVAVMYRGRVVEYGPADVVLDTPQHPYTQELFSVIPVPDPRRRGQIRMRAGSRRAADDDASDATSPGCCFAARCPHALPVCTATRPELAHRGTTVRTACHLYPPSAPAAVEHLDAVRSRSV